MLALRRGTTALGAVLLLLLAYAFARARSPSDHADRTFDLSLRGADVPITWPHQGQAALMIGTRWRASPHQPAVPIASLAKVMTAYLTLERFPLTGSQDGFTLTVTAAQAAAEARDAARD